MLSSLIVLGTYNTEFDEIIIRFTDQNGRLLEREDKVSILCLLINRINAMFYRMKSKKMC